MAATSLPADGSVMFREMIFRLPAEERPGVRPRLAKAREEVNQVTTPRGSPAPEKVCTATQPHFQRSRARRLPRAFSSPPCRSSRPAANQSGAPAGHRALGSSGVSKRTRNASMRPHKTPPLPHLSRALPPKACIRKAAAQRMRPGKLVHEDELMEVVQVLAKLSSRSLINLSYLDLESLLWSLLGNKIEGTRMGTHHHRQQTSLQTSNPTHPNTQATQTYN